VNGRPPETGYDTPPPGQSWPGGSVVPRPRPGKLARRLVFALIVGALAGAAIMLQVKGWGTLASEAGGSCGSGGQGVSHGACPRGITPALLTSFLIGTPAVPAAAVLLFRKGWGRRALLAVGAAGGVLAGQSLFAGWHGTDLSVAWTAPYDTSAQLSTVSAWASGDSLIRVRVDRAVSYDATTGRQRWALPMPGIDVACGVSGTSSSSAVGLISYGQDSASCDHVLAVNLATGRRLWSDPVQNPYTGNSPTGALAVAGGSAIVLTDDGIAGVSARSGVQRWTLAPPSGCSFQDLAAAGGNVVALAGCAGSYYVVRIDPAAGKAAWRYHVTEPADSYQFQILSVSPVVINDDLSGPRGTSTVRVFAANGVMTSAFSVSGISLAGGTVALNTASTRSGGFAAPVVVADGMVAGVTDTNGGRDAIVGYRLSDGKQAWLVDTPDEVHDVTLSGRALTFVDESDPAYSLESVDLATGRPHSLGFFSQAVLQTDGSGLYAVNGYDLIVNQDGDSGNQVPVAAIKAPALPLATRPRSRRGG
jgi:outer membrane protein assembly factor BamB